MLDVEAPLAQAAGGGPGAVGAPRVLPIDPQRTQPGARPSPLTAQPPLADPTPPKGERRRRVLVAVAAVVLLVAGAVGGPWFTEAADAFVTAFASVGAVGAVLAGVSAYAVWRLVPADLTLDDAHH